jgi:ribosomal protein L29
MKASKIREQADEELVQREAELSKRLIEIKVRRATAEGAESPMQSRTLRRELAQVKTILRERRKAS